MKRFVVYPGEVISKEDFDRHWISARQLMSLYRVQPHECIVIDERFRRCDPSGRQERELLKTLMPLYPMAGLDYRPVSDRERARYPLEPTCV